MKSRITVTELAILVPVVLLSSLFRFWDLTRIGLRGDEAVYAGQSLILAGNQEMTRFFVLASRGTSNFLFHQGVQALVYAVAGFSDLTTRILPASLSVCTVFVTYLLGRELFNRETGLLAAFFLAINGYAVAIGRLALLDSTMTFLFTVSILCLAKWYDTRRSGWLYLFAGIAGIAIMTKTSAAIIILIALLTLFITGRFRALDSHTLARSFFAFMASISAAILQFLHDPYLYIAFLSEGTSRVSNVSPTYYLDTLVVASGPYFIAVALLGLVIAMVFRSEGDIMCLVWIVVVAIFLQIYPLKAFNYVLPLVPAASVLAGRGMVAAVRPLKSLVSGNPGVTFHFHSRTLVAIAGVILLIWSSYSQGYTSVHNIAYDRPFVGLREAAYWLRDNAPPGSSVMTLSQGSAQYVLSLYAKIDSYPFGNFRLHTILPGGGIIAGAPSPELLIQNGTVRYLVHYVSWGGDDPIHVPVKTPAEQRFIDLIQKYQCHVRHVVYYEFTGLDGIQVREPRVWIYEVGKLLPEPQLDVQLEYTLLRLSAEGFLINSHVTVYYGRTLLGEFPTDDRGSFRISIMLPTVPTYGEQLVVFDDGGNRVSTILGSDLSQQ